MRTTRAVAALWLAAFSAAVLAQAREAWRGRTMSGLTRPMRSSVNVNCSTMCPAESTVAARTSIPVFVSA